MATDSYFPGVGGRFLRLLDVHGVVPWGTVGSNAGVTAEPGSLVVSRRTSCLSPVHTAPSHVKAA